MNRPIPEVTYAIRENGSGYALCRTHDRWTEIMRAPSPAELQFWQEIQELRQALAPFAELGVRASENVGLQFDYHTRFDVAHADVRRAMELVAAGPVDVCRRCGDCKGYSHHWMVDLQEDLESEYACKHCPQRGTACERCDGRGCEECHGEGVLPV